MKSKSVAGWRYYLVCLTKTRNQKLDKIDRNKNMKWWSKDVTHLSSLRVSSKALRFPGGDEGAGKGRNQESEEFVCSQSCESTTAKHKAGLFWPSDERVRLGRIASSVSQEFTIRLLTTDIEDWCASFFLFFLVGLEELCRSTGIRPFGSCKFSNRI